MALAKLISVAMEEGVSASANMEAAVTEGTSTFLSVVTIILNFVTTNPLLVVLFVGGTFLPLGIILFKKLKKASR